MKKIGEFEILRFSDVQYANMTILVQLRGHDVAQIICDDPNHPKIDLFDTEKSGLGNISFDVFIEVISEAKRLLVEEISDCG